MNNSKKGFIIYYDYRQHLVLLDDEDRGKLLMALLDYSETGQEPELSGATLMAYSFIKAQIDRDASKYNETIQKRSQAGQLGGRPSESKEKQTKANETKAKQKKQIQ